MTEVEETKKKPNGCLITLSSIIGILVILIIVTWANPSCPNHGQLLHTGIITSYTANSSNMWEGNAQIEFEDGFTASIPVPLIQDSMQNPKHMPEFGIEYDLFYPIREDSHAYLLRPHGSILNNPKVD